MLRPGADRRDERRVRGRVGAEDEVQSAEHRLLVEHVGIRLEQVVVGRCPAHDTTAACPAAGLGALFTFGSEDSASTETAPRFARIYGFSPFAVEKGAGVAVAGELR